MKFTPHDFQQDAIDHAAEFLRTGLSDGKHCGLYVSPTGSGKGVMIAGLHEFMNREEGLCYTVVPSHEIAQSVYEKWTGEADADRQTLEQRGVWTTKRLYNEIQAGRVPLPKYMIFDEGQHSVDNTHVTLWALCGFCPRADFTATDYRGTPAETAKLRSSYRFIRTVLTLAKAVERGIIARPDFKTWPLIDDHQIDVVNGEFVVKQVDNVVADKLADLVHRMQRFHDGRLYDRPTMVVFSSVAQCRNAVSVFRQSGLPAVVVVGESDPLFERDRQSAFRRVVGREVLLLSVAVVGEGVDLPLRRLVDISPTMSPMKCMQRWGRVTRPTDVAPEIISCCHNFTRHSYLWHGVVPAGIVKENQQAWGKDFKLTRRDMARAIGLEGFGRFQPNFVPLLDGTIGTLYALQTQDGLTRYAVYLGPTDPEPKFFRQEFRYTGETDTFEKNGHQIEYRVKTRSNWEQIDRLPDLVDCLSVKPDPITPKMRAWWERSAARCGLDVTHTPNAREFQILPICCNTKQVLT